MNADEPALFDMPCERQPAASPLGQRGRNRETWSRTVAAEITVVDAEALRDAAREARECAVEVAPHERTGDEEEADAEEPDVEAEAHVLDAVTWLLWPTATMEAQEVGAIRVLKEDIEVTPLSEDRGTLTWTVTVKLTDADALRRLAAQADPDQVASIRDSLAAAWQLAADPFEPLQSIPGITWRPGPVTVQHRPRKH